MPVCLKSPSGRLDLEEQKPVLEAQQDAIANCLGERTTPAGLELTVGPDGAVTSVGGRDGATLDDEHELCVAEVLLRSARFPAPGCNGSLVLPWRFRAGAPPEPWDESVHEEVAIDEPVGLQKSVIAAVIKSHWDQVELCYERRLALATMEGKITALFLIDSAGSVPWIALKEDTFADPQVGRCIVGAIRGWEFPPPVGGGTVTVLYPWVFRLR